MKPLSAGREWLYALGWSALAGTLAVGVWFLVLLATLDRAHAVNVAVKQGVWLVPSAIVLLSPAILVAVRRGAGRADGKS